MRLRRLWLILLGVLVLVGLIVVVVRPDREPSYGGRNLSQWVARIDGTAKSDTTKEAAEAIRHIGTNALPYLLKWIQYERPPWKNALHRITGGRLERYDFLLDHKNEIRAEHAMKAFRVLGPQACGAIPELLRLMNDSNRSWSAGRATFTIVGMGTNARPVLPTLIAMLTNDSLARRTMYALGELKLEPQLVVPALTNCLLRSNATIRFYAAHALCQFGGDARSAVPALVRALNDSNGRVQHWASNALVAIDPQALEQSLNHREAKQSE